MFQQYVFFPLACFLLLFLTRNKILLQSKAFKKYELLTRRVLHVTDHVLAHFHHSLSFALIKFIICNIFINILSDVYVKRTYGKLNLIQHMLTLKKITGHRTNANVRVKMVTSMSCCPQMRGCLWIWVATTQKFYMKFSASFDKNGLFYIVQISRVKFTDGIIFGHSAFCFSCLLTHSCISYFSQLWFNQRIHWFTCKTSYYLFNGMPNIHTLQWISIAAKKNEKRRLLAIPDSNSRPNHQNSTEKKLCASTGNWDLFERNENVARIFPCNVLCVRQTHFSTLVNFQFPWQTICAKSSRTKRNVCSLSLAYVPCWRRRGDELRSRSISWLWMLKIYSNCNYFALCRVVVCSSTTGEKVKEK